MRTCHDVRMNRVRTISATLLLLTALLAGCKPAAPGPTASPATTPVARLTPQVVTVTIVGAVATIYGARATEVVIGAPMRLSHITDLVVVAIATGPDGGSCVIRADGARVGTQASAPGGSAAACIWDRRAGH
jgi:hypothetical protein